MPNVGHSLFLRLAVVALVVAGVSTSDAAAQCCILDGGFAAGRLLVTFHPGTTEDTVRQVALETQTEVIRYLYNIGGSGPTWDMRVPVEQELSYETLFEGRPEVVRVSPDTHACTNQPACSCCPPGIVCRELEPCVRLTPTEILLDRSPVGEQIIVSWGPSCPSGDETDHILYEGELGNFASHQPLSCTDAVPFMEETVAPSPGDRYYLVVPRVSNLEGSHGMDSRWLDRQRGAAVCLPTQTFTPCS